MNILDPLRDLKSRAVSWWPVWQFVNAIADKCTDEIPLAGTPAWQALADNDPRKLLACAIGGVHHALRMETAQEARAQAAKDIAASTDWPAVGRELQQRRTCAHRIERKKTDVA